MMRKITALILFCFVFTTYHALAQKDITDKLFDLLEQSVPSDRPGQALNANTAGMFALQIQTGFNYNRYDLDPNHYTNSYFVPTTIRVGITPRFELNTTFSYLNYNSHSLLGDSEVGGFLSPDIGFRYQFIKGGERWKPNFSLQANLSIPSDQGAFVQQQVGSSFYLVTSNQFNWFSVNTNLGLFWDGSGAGFGKPTVPYVFNLGFQMSKKWSSFVEIFGSLDGEGNYLNYDAGFAFNPIKSLQIDFFGGYLPTQIDGAHSWFVEAGLSYRFSFLKYFAKKNLKEILK